MTEKALITILCHSNLSKAKNLIPEKALYINKNCRLKRNDGKRITMKNHEFIILMSNGERAGGIFIMGDWDLHFHIFQKYRGTKLLSDFMRSGWLYKLHPNLKSITCIHREGSEEYLRVQHIAKLAGLEIRGK